MFGPTAGLGPKATRAQTKIFELQKREKAAGIRHETDEHNRLHKAFYRAVEEDNKDRARHKAEKAKCEQAADDASGCLWVALGICGAIGGAITAGVGALVGIA